MSNSSVRTVLISDQPIYLRGMEALLATMPQISLVGAGCSAAEALQVCRLTGPDLLVVDLRHLVEETCPLVRQVNTEWPNCSQVVLVDMRDDHPIPPDLQNQPVYCYSRDLNDDEFRAALDQACCAPANFQMITVKHSSPDEDEEADPPRVIVPPRSEALLTRELEMAGKIQADILPEEPPIIRGWDLAATLLPARETSGDFYDFIPLSVHKWGLVAADVTDKGMGAALLMALSSTLFRTYAVRYPTLPAVTLTAVNERILSDTRGGMFVTAFFGIFEPHTGRFVYANAGHPSGFLVGTRRGKETIDRLRPTGMALGVDEQARWRQRDLRIGPGDLLVLYTDGITEAESQQGTFYGEERLLDVILRMSQHSAREILDAVVDDARRFAGTSPRQDDVALIVIRRLE